MGIVDAILVLILFAYWMFGWRKGLLSVLGFLVGNVGGLLAAISVANWAVLTFEGGNLMRVVVFSFVFLIIHRLINSLLGAFANILKILTYIPLTKLLNSFTGAALSFGVGIVFTSVVLSLLSKYTIHDGLTDLLLTSTIVPVLVDLNGLIGTWVPLLVI